MRTGRDEWSSDAHVAHYHGRTAIMDRRAGGDRMLDEIVPAAARRVLDLGTGDGRLVRLLARTRPGTAFVALDISPPMLAAARELAAALPLTVVEHDLGERLPELGTFDAVVSAFAIHHLEDDRKRALLDELVAALEPGGVDANLEHVSSPTPRLHAAFLAGIGITADEEDASNRCRPLEPQLEWMREAGLTDVDCLWKWREMALLAGIRPSP